MEIILIIGVFFLSKLFTRFISFSFFFFSHWREKERKMNCARSLSKRNRSNHSNVFRRLIIIGNEFQRGGRCSFVYSIQNYETLCIHQLRKVILLFRRRQSRASNWQFPRRHDTTEEGSRISRNPC